MARSSDEMRKIDKFIGERLYNLRLNARMSRQRLSEIMGISYQQTNKYEAGVNRISASRMFLIANALNIKPEIFYEGLAEYLASNTENNDIHNHNHNNNHNYSHNVSLCNGNISDLTDTRYLPANLSGNKLIEKDKKSSGKRLLKLRSRRNAKSHDDVTDKNDAYSDESLDLEYA